MDDQCISDAQVKKLNSLGWEKAAATGKIRACGIIEKASKEKKWMDKFEELKRYKEKNNGSMVFPTVCDNEVTQLK